jgi:hypothetical protein
MPPLDAERREIADKVRLELAVENELTAHQARLFVRCLQITWQVPSIRWRKRESQAQMDDAWRLMHAAEVFSDVDGEGSARAVDCYRRAAELLEWLSRAGDEVNTIAPIALYAASAYQLGGLPAMAASLLRQVETVSEDGRLYAEFLRADFDAVLRTCVNFWRQHALLTGRHGSESLLVEEDDDRVDWFIVVELVRTLGLIAESLRRGDEGRLSKAQQKLRGLEKVVSRSAGEDAWLLVRLMRKTADRFAAASLYPQVMRLTEAAPGSGPRLRTFAREQFARGRGILWTSQLHGLERLLTNSSFALCTPTGSGKTLVANLALVKELLISAQKGMAPLALYVVPSRALAGEIEAKLTAELGKDFIITGLYGGADWGISDYWIQADKPTVLIATVEKADALMRYLGLMLLMRLRLLIVDEAHQVVTETNERARISFADHSSRSMRLEAFVSRLLALKPDIVRVALTAVAGGAAGPVARWIEGQSDAEPVGTNYRSARQLIGMLQAVVGDPGRILLDLMNGRPLHVRDRQEDAVYLPLRIPPMPRLPAPVRDSLNHYNQLNVLWTALHLGDGGRRILIFVAQEPEMTMRWFAEAFALPAWSQIGNFSGPDDDTLRQRFQEAREACIDYCGDNSYELALLDRGIATNHGQMPQHLRRLMIDLIDRRICPITLATATLSEGVNLPFDLIFMTSLCRSTYDAVLKRQVRTPIATSEFRNLVGRAGRPGTAEGMEGMTLVAVPQEPSTTAEGKFDKQHEQVQALKQDYEQLLSRLTAEESQQTSVMSPLALLLNAIAQQASNVLGISSPEDFLNWLETAIPETISPQAGRADNAPDARLADSLDELDGVLLAAVEELGIKTGTDGESAASEAILVDLWSRTFARVAAVQEAWLEQAFVHRGRAICNQIYPDQAERRKLYQYGFTPCIGRRFDTVAPAIRAELAAMVDYGSATPADRLSMFERIGETLASDRGFGFRVRETSADRALLSNWVSVLGWWMQAPGAIRPLPNSAPLRRALFAYHHYLCRLARHRRHHPFADPITQRALRIDGSSNVAIRHGQRFVTKAIAHQKRVCPSLSSIRAERVTEIMKPRAWDRSSFENALKRVFERAGAERFACLGPLDDPFGVARQRREQRQGRGVQSNRARARLRVLQSEGSAGDIDLGPFESENFTHATTGQCQQAHGGRDAPHNRELVLHRGQRLAEPPHLVIREEALPPVLAVSLNVATRIRVVGTEPPQFGEIEHL